MTTSYNSHNANLSMTLSNDSVAVNRFVSTYPSSKMAELASSNTKLHSTSPSNNHFEVLPTDPSPANTSDLVYVKIDNNIFNLGLALKVIEYYVLLTYLVLTNPNLRLTVRGIVHLLNTKMFYSLNKNTVNKYNKALIAAGLMTIQAGNGLIVLGLSNKDNHGDTIRSTYHSTNYYIKPRSNFTNFYPLLWDRMKETKSVNVSGVIAKGNYILEHYFATKNFTAIANPFSNYRFKFRSKVVTRELGISRSTYYTRLKSLVVSGVIGVKKVVGAVKSFVSNSNIGMKFNSTAAPTPSVSKADTFPLEGLGETRLNGAKSPHNQTFQGEGVDEVDGRGQCCFNKKTTESNQESTQPKDQSTTHQTKFHQAPITYLNTLRIQVLNYLDPILRELRLKSYNHKYQAAQVKKTRDEQMLLRNIHNSRYYFTGILGQYMIKYKVTYCKFMNNIDPDIALEIIENLEYTYQKRGKTINAQLISAALRGGWRM